MKHFGKGRWCYRPVALADVDALARQGDLPAALAEVLLRRGEGVGEGSVRDFLEPGLRQLPAPTLLGGMDRATTILADALQHGRPVVVYADYDVDGLTGAAVLHQFFREAGRAVTVVQPDRFTCGYGLHARLVDDIARSHGPGTVLVTVDCGISDAAEVLAAKRAGLSVIITDHHLPPEHLPQADAVINPRQAGCTFPFKALAGAGVAFYLAAGLRQKLRDGGFWNGREEPNLRRYLDLTAIGTICDMVPLQGVNRVLAGVGLDVLATTERPGLVELKRAAGYEAGQAISAFDVGYRLGPRLNAAGRMGSPQAALRLLLAADRLSARGYASELETLNLRRREETEKMTERAKKILSDVGRRRTLLVGGRGWHIGVLGIVASRLLEEYYRPTIVYSIDEAGVAKASGRSVTGFDLHRALVNCTDLLDRFGGHSQAAGLSIAAERLLEFGERFEAEAHLVQVADKPPGEIDAVIKGDFGGSETFLRAYRKLMPFGEGNAEPVFAMCGCSMRDVGILKDRHLRCAIPFGDRLLPCIGFGLAEAMRLEDEPVDMVFALRPNFFRGEERWQAHLFSVERSATD